MFLHIYYNNIILYYIDFNSLIQVNQKTNKKILLKLDKNITLCYAKENKRGKMENNKTDTHKNHRKRLKTKVKNYGLECLAYHEILELLLTYTIPRKDTNPIAHNLIDRFGSFANVIDANYYDLLKVDGVGPESALLLNALSSFMEIYNKSKLETGTSVLDSVAKCVKFFRDFYRVKNNEFMVMVCLGKNKRVVRTFLYKGKDETEISFDLRQISHNINDSGVHSIVLFHTHPCGSVEPSSSDLSTTQTIINICLFNGIDFDDHIILNESEHYSFKNNGLIDKMKLKFANVFAITDIRPNKFDNLKDKK